MFRYILSANNPKFLSIAGTALLEWILASLLGIFLIVALERLFQTIATDHSFREAQSAAIITLAVTEQTVSKRLHLSTALPCGNTPGQINLVNDGSALYWLDLFASAKQIHPYDSEEASAIRRLGTAAGERAAGSDVLVILAAQQPIRVVTHNVEEGILVLAEASLLRPGEFAIVCDPQVTALFQITRQFDQGQRLAYRGGGVSPGNCANDFDINRPCAPNTAYIFSDHALLTVFEPAVLFVGQSHHPGRRSLYRERLSLTQSGDGNIRAGMRREEIIEGVEILRARSLSDNVVDFGIVAAAPLPVADLTPASVHLLGRDVTSWLSDHGSLYDVTEFSVAL